MPRRPARPVSWVYWAGRQRLVVVAGELGELLDHHAPGRHVDADGQRLGREHDLDQTLDETALDDLLERRHHAGVVGGDTGLELGHELRVPEDVEICRQQPVEALIGDLPHTWHGLLVVREPETGIDAHPGGLVALRPTEDEVDRRQQIAVVQRVDGLEARRRGELAGAAPSHAAVVTAATRRDERHSRRVDARRCSGARRRSSAAGAGGRSCGRRRSTCCRAAPGASLSTTAVVGPRTVSIHSDSSSALLTVAERQTNCTCCGRWMMTSSQTGPR